MELVCMCVCACVCILKKGRGRINWCRICHGDICVPWRSSRSPLYLCNLQLSALTSFRPPLAPTTRPARPKGLGYKYKRVRKIGRGKGLGGCRRDEDRELQGRAELKEREVVEDIERNEASMGNWEKEDQKGGRNYRYMRGKCKRKVSRKRQARSKMIGRERWR